MEVRLGVVVLCLVFSLANFSPAKLTLKMQKDTGMFSLSLGKGIVLNNTDVFVTYEGKKYSTDDGSLNLFKQGFDSGTDTFGEWVAHELYWKVTSSVLFKTIIKSQKVTKTTLP